MHSSKCLLLLYLVRLVNGSNIHEGRVEVFYGGKWGMVCSEFFNDMAARVVCKMLDFPR